MLVLPLVQKQTGLFLTQPLTILYLLQGYKNLFLDMQFFNPFRFSFGLLSLCFFIFISYFTSFSLFLTAWSYDISYINVYRKKDVSGVQIFQSYSLFSLSSLVYVDQLIKHLVITLTCHF